MLADDFPANVLHADSQKPTAGGALLIKVGCPRPEDISDLAIKPFLEQKLVVLANCLLRLN